MPNSLIPLASIGKLALCLLPVLASSFSLQAASGTWTNLAGGSWTDAANWTGTVPGGADGLADFSTLALAGDTTVTLDGALTNGTFIFADVGATANWFLNTGSGGPLTLATSTGTPAINVSNQTATLNVVLAGTNGFTKTGTGVLALGATNTYSGGTIISAGTLRMVSTGALNSATSVILGSTSTGSATTVFQFGPSSVSGTIVETSPIIISSNAPAATAWLDNNPASTQVGVINGSITLQNHDLWFTNSGSQLYQINGLVTGTGNVYIATTTYGHRVRLASNGNTFAGDVHILNGGLQTGTGAGGTANSIPDNSDVYMSAGTLLGLGASDSFGALNGGDPDLINSLTNAVVGANISSVATLSLTLGNNNHNGIFGGALLGIDVGNNSAGHNLSLTKLGTGTQTLNGNCTFTGATTVSGGTLIINSNYSSAITIATNATLGGSGSNSATVVVSNGGTLSPGNSVGTLTTANETWNAGGRYLFQLSSATNSAGWDLLQINGTLTLAATAANPFIIRLQTMANSTIPGLVPDFDKTATYSWTIATVTNAISGFDPAKFTVDSTLFSNVTAGAFSVGTNGNSLVVNYSKLPIVTLTLPTNTTYAAYATIPLAATVVSNGNVITKVQFLTNGVALTQVTSVPYAANWTFAAPGVYTIVARAFVGANFADSTNSVLVTVNPPVPPILSGAKHENNGFSFTFTGPNGQPYTVLSSTNVALPVVNWQTSGTGYFTASGPASFTNATPTDPKRFYRIRSP